MSTREENIDKEILELKEDIWQLQLRKRKLEGDGKGRFCANYQRKTYNGL